MSDSKFLLDSFSKAKIFSNFSAGNNFLFFKRFRSDRCHITVTVSLLEKRQSSYFQFFCLTA